MVVSRDNSPKLELGAVTILEVCLVKVVTLILVTLILVDQL